VGWHEGNAPGHNWIILPLGRFHRLLPPRSAQTPFAAGLEADAAEVVAARSGEVEEFFAEDPLDAR